VNDAGSGAGALADFGELGKYFAELAGALRREGGSLIDFDMDRLVRVGQAAVPNADHVALTMIRGSNPPETCARTDEVADQVDAIQYDVGNGPCLEAIRENDITRSNDLEHDDQWPGFAERTVAETPVRSMAGVRLVIDGPNRAALNFYADRPHAFSDLDLGVAAILSSFASLAMQRQLAERKVDNLEIALESSRQIGAAMGVLMARKLMTEEQAFQQLRDASQHLHRKLRDVARDVLESGELPGRD
jgi:GAF domain-containing protein